MTSKTKKITRVGVVAGLYAALTLALGFISYGPIQFRIAEVMTLLPLFGKEYILSLTIGCFLANVIGPYGLPDIILGTLHCIASKGDIPKGSETDGITYTSLDFSISYACLPLRNPVKWNL